MKLCIVLLFFVFSCSAQGQSFHYINYNIKDGLAGSIVYSMCQDKDGFMWFGTDNGLSRYDGTHFKNFTIKDGLPDNEVLKVFADSKGRVWIGTFSKEVCFYFNGKIYNRNNNDLLKKIEFESNVESIFEDSKQFLCIGSKLSIKILTPGDSLIEYSVRDICLNDAVWGVPFNFYGRIRLRIETSEIYDYNNEIFSWVKKPVMPFTSVVSENTSGRLFFDSSQSNSIYVTFPGNVLSMSFAERPKFINTTKGVWLYDSISNKFALQFLPEFQIPLTVEDAEKNIWFATLGSGLFKLPSLNSKTLLFDLDLNKGKEIYTLVKYKNSLLAGTNFNSGFLIDTNFTITKFSFSSFLQNISKFGGPGRLFSSTSISNTVAILGFDGSLGKLDDDKPTFKYLGGPIKSVEKINDSFFIAGTSLFAFKIKVKDLSVVDTLWRERCTKVFFANGNYYIGTLAGLYEVKEDKSFYYMGNLHPTLSRRIMDIKKDPSGVLWISTSDRGVIGIKDRKIVKVIDDNIGLSSNNGKTLFVKDNYLWIGTNNGICKVNISPGSKDGILKYSVSDGLPSNNINTIYVDDSAVWVGTPEGLTYFKEKDISASSICNLKMIRVSIGDSLAAIDSAYNLSYKKNDIRFEFAGISFRSGGEIIYYYKLNGIDRDWKTTSDNFLDYKTLPSGNYRLQLYAVNKYGVKSNVITIPLSVSTPFWKTAWFYILTGLVIAGCIIYLFNRRNRITKERLEETNRVQKQFAELEQQALQSQMNPHFIFNCLNSIQQYIFTGENEKANQYLTDFAYLIRQTLNISSQKTISLSEEIQYLTRYLEMEQLRFGNTFKFHIETKDINNADLLQIPSLLIQPFVENCLRHGIRHLTDRDGLIEILFYQDENKLTCKIKDNGVGREKAAEYKSKKHIEYQSKGISLTGKRINLLNMVSEKKISLNIADLKDEKNKPAGTLVELIIPL